MSEYELLVKRTGLAGLSNFVVSLSPIILLPILTKLLTIEEYGIWTLIVVTASFVPVLVSLGLTSSLVRFLAPVINKEEIREGYYSVALAVVCASLVASLLIFLLEQLFAGLGSNYVVVVLLPLITFVASYNGIPQAYFRAFQQAKRYSFVLFLQACLYVILVAAFVLLGFGLAGAALGYLIGLVVTAAASTYYVVRDIGIALPKLTEFRAYLKYGLPLMPANVSNWALNVSDRYIITFFLGVAWVGYYSPGYQLGNMVSLWSVPFGLIAPTALYQYYEAKRMAEVKTVISYSIKYFLAIAVPTAFLFSILSKPILTILTTSDIAANGYLITPFTAFSSLLYGVFAIIVTILTFEKRTVIIGTTWILGAALNIGLNLVLVPRLGIIAAAMTTVVGYGFVFVVTAVYSVRQMKLDLDFGFILKSVFASVVISSLAFLWHVAGLLSILGLILVCAAVYTALLFVLKGFSTNEIDFFRAFLARSR